MALQDIPKTYRAKIQVYELVETTDVTKSVFQSTNPETEELLLAGMVKQGEKIYKTWTEDVPRIQDLTWHFFVFYFLPSFCHPFAEIIFKRSLATWFFLQWSFSRRGAEAPKLASHFSTLCDASLAISN